MTETQLKIGIDGGGGFLKVCLNVLSDDIIPMKKRLFFKDGISSKKLKSTSVKKLIILAIAPGIKENYENVAQILMTLKLDELPSTPTVRYAADLKMVNLLLGSCHMPLDKPADIVILQGEHYFVVIITISL